jgi:hypothetical protein
MEIIEKNRLINEFSQENTKNSDLLQEKIQEFNLLQNSQNLLL